MAVPWCRHGLHAAYKAIGALLISSMDKGLSLLLADCSSFVPGWTRGTVGGIPSRSHRRRTYPSVCGVCLFNSDGAPSLGGPPCVCTHPHVSLMDKAAVKRVLHSYGSGWRQAPGGWSLGKSPECPLQASAIKKCMRFACGPHRGERQRRARNRMGAVKAWRNCEGGFCSNAIFNLLRPDGWALRAATILRPRHGWHAGAAIQEELMF